MMSTSRMPLGNHGSRNTQRTGSTGVMGLSRYHCSGLGSHLISDLLGLCMPVRNNSLLYTQVVEMTLINTTPYTTSVLVPPKLPVVSLEVVLY